MFLAFGLAQGLGKDPPSCLQSRVFSKFPSPARLVGNLLKIPFHGKTDEIREALLGDTGQNRRRTTHHAGNSYLNWLLS
jgi:hypothetical protein